MTISITAAIAAATEQTAIVKVSRGSYQVRTFDDRLGMYRVGTTTDYAKARAILTETRHALALNALGWDNMDALDEACGREFGSLRDRVKRSVARA